MYYIYYIYKYEYIYIYTSLKKVFEQNEINEQKYK